MEALIILHVVFDDPQKSEAHAKKRSHRPVGEGAIGHRLHKAGRIESGSLAVGNSASGTVPIHIVLADKVEPRLIKQTSHAAPSKVGMDADIGAIESLSVWVGGLEGKAPKGLLPRQVGLPSSTGDSACTGAPYDTALLFDDELTTWYLGKMGFEMMPLPQSLFGKRLGEASSLEGNHPVDVLMAHASDVHRIMLDRTLYKEGSIWGILPDCV